jgi:hypothetical protein
VLLLVVVALLLLVVAIVGVMEQQWLSWGGWQVQQ